MNAAEQQGHLEQRLAILERRIRRYQRLGLMLGLGFVLAVSLAARQPPSKADAVQTSRLEVLDPEGRARVVAYATPAGGRLEVLDEAGRVKFSAGAVQGGPEPVGRWEQALRSIEQHGRELDRQRRLLDDLSRPGRTGLQPPPGSGERDRQRQEVDRLRQDVDMQRRTIDLLERQVQSLANQVQTRSFGR